MWELYMKKGRRSTSSEVVEGLRQLRLAINTAVDPLGLFLPDGRPKDLENLPLEDSFYALYHNSVLSAESEEGEETEEASGQCGKA